MKPLLVVLGILFVGAIVLSSAGGILAQLAEPSAAEIAADWARAEQIRQQAELEADWAPRRALVLNLALFMVVAGGAAYVLGLAGLHLKHTAVYAHPDARGLLPVARADQHTARAALFSFHAARLEEACRPVVPQVPHVLHYSYEPKIAGLPAPAPLLPGDVVTAPSVPTFAQLLGGGRVGRGQPLLLGYDLDNDGAELPGSWADLYSTITSGLPGTGKTTSQRFYACQTALHGARFVVCDPHAGAGDDSLAATLAPLRAAYLVEPAETPATILEAARFVAAEGAARVAGRSADRRPVILWVDELTALLGRSDVGDALAHA